MSEDNRLGKLLRKQGLLHSIGRNVNGVTALEYKWATLSKAGEEQSQRLTCFPSLYVCTGKAVALFVEDRKGGNNLNPYKGRMD